jgi:class 3 adenylate cyclase
MRRPLLGHSPEPQAPPAIVSRGSLGFTKLTEKRVDETAVRIATSLQRQADATAARYGGRSVKLLGDGAMLRFSEPAAGLDAALDLVRTMGDEGARRGVAKRSP